MPPLEEPAGNSSILIEHRCGTKQIDMTIDEHAASGILLKDLLLNKLYAPPPLDDVVYLTSSC
jgi:hypothetical protein